MERRSSEVHGRWRSRASCVLAGMGALALAAACDSVGRDGLARRDADTTVAPGVAVRTAATTPAAGGTGVVARLPADDGQWTMAAKDYANTRYSALDEITTSNVRGLRLAWSFSTGNRNGHEAAPLVAGGTMYVVTPFPNQVYALDLTQPGAPVKWSYTPPQLQAAEGVACCDVVNRGAAYADGRIFFATLDNQVVALDAATGNPAWRVRVGDVNRGETMTMAPVVVKGKVLVGNSGGEMGVRGWLTALDAATGQIAWRAYSTGPDEDVLIGAGFRPFYGMDSGPDLGVRSWPGDAWKTGGGTVWGWISYDPELDLVYYGTGNPGPWNSAQRPGDNKWTAGIFARDPDTGAARWFYQTAPSDHYDYDGINEAILVEMPVDGTMRRVLVHPGRNGYMYVIDRATGQVLSATPYVHVNSSSGVDLETGRLAYAPDKLPREGTVVRDICPASPGAKDWQPSSFSPRTGLLYVPHQNLCMDWEAVETGYIAGTPFVGVNAMFKAGPGGHRGFVTAWDPVAKRPAWQLKEFFPVWSGTLVTAGDVVFYGTMDRWFKAVDARTGELLWQFRTASGIIGQPVTYRGPDGKQYVAILDGVGGWSGAIVPLLLSASDSLAGGGFVGAMADLPQYTNAGGTLYVFALP